jgi:acetylornithine/succinyldiaminopimelate/putrescine aminotransferase/predicted amino acid dehydrogenase
MILPTALGHQPPDGPEPSRESVHFKPRLTQLLETLHLDVHFERGAGCHLYYRDAGGAEIEVLDLVGGYGSLMLGHAHPDLVAEAQRLLAAGHPVHTQGSSSVLAESLARELSRRAGGDYCVVFGNSGTEAVEAAVKHAMLETGSRTFIALERGFHGKTLGALQFTANPAHRAGWETADLTVIRVPLNDEAALERAFAEAGRPAGFMYEPVQGEGGVHVMTASFAQRAAALCRAAGAPLIADECQTGLGRTGTFLASEQLGVQPDYIILSKALGGGLAKISALLVRRERYCDTFDLKQTSTFAGDDFSCALALRTLALITPELMTASRSQGETLLNGLRQLAARHPSVIAGVRGKGLLAAVQFHPLTRSPSFVLRFLGTQQDLGYALTSHLLARHRLRVAPTLSDRFTLRLEPPALISDADIQRTLDALDDVCRLLANDDAMALTRHVGHGRTRVAGRPRFMREDGQLMFYDPSRCQSSPASPPAAKVAWLCHMVDAGDLAALDPSFATMPDGDREDFLAHWVSRAAPVVMSRVAVRSALGRVVEFHPIMLPFTSRWVKEAIDARALAPARALVQQGVNTAAALGCELVSLGQYTSMVTVNGTRLDSQGLGVTTGNSYAIALAIQAVRRACRERGLEPAAATLVVAGATGNIGRTCAEILAGQFRKVILIGSAKPGSLARLRSLAATLPNAMVATDLAATAKGDVVVAAMNAVNAPLEDDHLAPGALVCDLSVPASVRPAVLARRPDLRVIKGGIAALPFHEDLQIAGFPRPAGQAYGCMAEAMLLGFEGIRDRVFTGQLTPDHVARVARMADRHGFKLAAPKTACVLGTDHRNLLHASSL